MKYDIIVNNQRILLTNVTFTYQAKRHLKYKQLGKRKYSIINNALIDYNRVNVFEIVNI